MKPRTTVPFQACMLLVALTLAGGGCAQNPETEDVTEAGAATAQQAATGGEEDADLLPLPEFTDCASTDHPLLPERWQASALLQDFVRPMLTFGRFVYDDGVGAFRFRLANRSGDSFDFLVTRDRTLYLLEGGDNPTSCSFVRDDSPMTMPSRDWLAGEAVCVGEAPVLERELAWWKTPRGEGADWIWFGTGNGLPFRTMYYEDAPITDPVPVYEHFTFNYFPSFEELPSTDLGTILRMCRQAEETPMEVPGIDLARPDSIASGDPDRATHPETFGLAQSWIPGLDQCGSLALPPPWPDRVQGTVFMTAVSFEPNPFPTRVFYDWTKKALNTSLYYYPPTATDYVQVALLTGDTGYIRIEDEQGTVSMCEQALPGPQVPDWKQVDGCRCRAVLAPGTALNPGTEATQILWCPTDLSANQVFWTWYSNSGTPVVFMQTNSSPTAGTGLNLADYYHWKPGSVAPDGTFDLPAACEDKPKITVPTACHNCHLPLNE